MSRAFEQILRLSRTQSQVESDQLDGIKPELGEALQSLNFIVSRIRQMIDKEMGSHANERDAGEYGRKKKSFNPISNDLIVSDFDHCVEFSGLEYLEEATAAPDAIAKAGEQAAGLRDDDQQPASVKGSNSNVDDMSGFGAAKSGQPTAPNAGGELEGEPAPPAGTNAEVPEQETHAKGGGHCDNPGSIAPRAKSKSAIDAAIDNNKPELARLLGMLVMLNKGIQRQASEQRANEEAKHNKRDREV